MASSKLKEEITDLSNSNNWDDAKTEWKLSTAYYSKEPDRCLCGHYPIKNICIIENCKNGNNATVGNCCVNYFCIY